MSVAVVRYRAKPELADENQAFVEKVFAQLAAERPDGVQYMTLRLGDGVSFVHVAIDANAVGTRGFVAGADNG